MLASLCATGRVQIQPGCFPTHGELSTCSLSLAVLGVLFVAESARGGTERSRRLREGRKTPFGVFRNLNPDETRFARLV